MPWRLYVRDGVDGDLGVWLPVCGGTRQGKARRAEGSEWSQSRAVVSAINLALSPSLLSYILPFLAFLQRVNNQPGM